MTFIGILITANGIILIAAFNLMQIISKNMTLHHFLQNFVLGAALLSVISILLSLWCISKINPIPFDLSPHSNQIKDGTYDELLDGIYITINDYTINNRNRFKFNYSHYLGPSMIFFAFSIIILLIVFLLFTTQI